MTGRYAACTAMAVAIAMMVGGAAQAQTRYRPKGLLKPGYSDRRTAPGVWQVKGSSYENGGSVAVALYRAAELAMAEGVREIRVVKQQIKSTTTTTRTGAFVGYSEFARLSVRAVYGDADRMMCEMPEAAKCLTMPVAGILARYGPTMGMPAARPGESPAAPVQIVQTSRLRGLPDNWQPVVSPRGYTTPADHYPAWRPATVPAAPPPALVASRIPRPIASPIAASASPAPLPEATSYAARLAAAKPVQGRDAKQGWTISD